MHLNIGADANIVFSALYFGGRAAPFFNAVNLNKIDLYQSEYLKDELVAVAKRKYLPKNNLELFYSLSNVHVITDASYYSKIEFEAALKLVRDAADVPVFVFAKKMLSAGKIDFFVTGDNDLLEEKVRLALADKIISLAEFNEILISEREF